MARHLEAHVFLDESEQDKINCGDLFMAVGAFLKQQGIDPARSHHEALRNPDDEHAQEVLDRALGTAV